MSKRTATTRKLHENCCLDSLVMRKIRPKIPVKPVKPVKSRFNNILLQVHYGFTTLFPLSFPSFSLSSFPSLSHGLSVFSSYKWREGQCNSLHKMCIQWTYNFHVQSQGKGGVIHQMFSPQPWLQSNCCPNEAYSIFYMYIINEHSFMNLIMIFCVATHTSVLKVDKGLFKCRSSHKWLWLPQVVMKGYYSSISVKFLEYFSHANGRFWNCYGGKPLKLSTFFGTVLYCMHHDKCRTLNNYLIHPFYFLQNMNLFMAFMANSHYKLQKDSSKFRCIANRYRCQMQFEEGKCYSFFYFLQWNVWYTFLLSIVIAAIMFCRKIIAPREDNHEKRLQIWRSHQGYFSVFSFGNTWSPGEPHLIPKSMTLLLYQMMGSIGTKVKFYHLASAGGLATKTPEVWPELDVWLVTK